MFEDKVIPLDIWVSQFVDYLVDNYRDIFQALKWPVEQTLSGLDAGLNALSPIIVIVVMVLAAWRFSGKGLAIFTAITMTFVGLLGLWEETMTTLAMVLSSVIFCAIAGIPLGIWAGRSDAFEAGIRPVLDAMQTTPAFVYLVPIVMLFSVGNVAGVLATIILRPAPHYPPYLPGYPPGSSRIGRSGAGLWRHSQPGADPRPGPAGHAHYPGRIEPDHHDGAVHGRHRRTHWCRRAGFTGYPGPQHPGYRSRRSIGGLSIVLMAIVLDRITQSVAQRK